jgi:hypothetical protein
VTLTTPADAAGIMGELQLCQGGKHHLLGDRNRSPAADVINAILTPGGPTITAQYPIPTAGSGPNGIVAGPDGALWFTEYSGNKIGRITTGGSITEYRSPQRAAHRTASLLVLTAPCGLRNTATIRSAGSQPAEASPSSRSPFVNSDHRTSLPARTVLCGSRKAHSSPATSAGSRPAGALPSTRSGRRTIYR